jgi:hypothetical protein
MLPADDILRGWLLCLPWHLTACTALDSTSLKCSEENFTVPGGIQLQRGSQAAPECHKACLSHSTTVVMCQMCAGSAPVVLLVLWWRPVHAVKPRAHLPGRHDRTPHPCRQPVQRLPVVQREPHLEPRAVRDRRAIGACALTQSRAASAASAVFARPGTTAH